MKKFLPVFFAVALFLSACAVSFGAETPTAPTMSPLELQATAQAMAQISVQQTMMAMPTPTPFPTATPPPTPLPAIPLPTIPIGGGGEDGTGTTGSGCDSFSFDPTKVDVTIPDNTKFSPGDTFTKTWRIYNAGTCTWDTSYRLVFVLGDHMAGPDSVALAAEVKPGKDVEISVPLEVDTTKTGVTLTGNWRMQNGKGEFFGTFLTVTIRVVSAAPTDTPVPTDTPTPTPWIIIPTLLPTSTPWIILPTLTPTP